MKKVVKLTETDLRRITEKIMKEHFFEEDPEEHKSPNRNERKLVVAFKSAIKNKLESGGTDWATNVPNPSIKNLIAGIRKVCDEFENL